MVEQDPKDGTERYINAKGVRSWRRNKGRKPSPRPPVFTEDQINNLAPITEDELSEAFGGIDIRNMQRGQNSMKKRRNSKFKPRNMDVMIRRSKAMELLRAGKSYWEISQYKALGYKSARDVENDMVRLFNQLLAEPAQHVLALQLARLDRIMQVLWPTITDQHGELRDRNYAIREFFNAMEMRNNLLGLNKPQEMIHTSQDMLDREWARLAEEYQHERKMLEAVEREEAEIDAE